MNRLLRFRPTLSLLSFLDEDEMSDQSGDSITCVGCDPDDVTSAAAFVGARRDLLYDEARVTETALECDIRRCRPYRQQTAWTERPASSRKALQIVESVVPALAEPVRPIVNIK